MADERDGFHAGYVGDTLFETLFRVLERLFDQFLVEISADRSRRGLVNMQRDDLAALEQQALRDLKREGADAVFQRQGEPESSCTWRKLLTTGVGG